jgi:hypothetical protein
MTAILIQPDGQTAVIDLPADSAAQETVMRAVLRTDNFEVLYLDGKVDMWCDYAAWEAAGHLDKPHNEAATELGAHDIYGPALITGPNYADLATSLTGAQVKEVLATLRRLRAAV